MKAGSNWMLEKSWIFTKEEVCSLLCEDFKHRLNIHSSFVGFLTNKQDIELDVQNGGSSFVQPNHVCQEKQK